MMLIFELSLYCFELWHVTIHDATLWLNLVTFWQPQFIPGSNSFSRSLILSSFHSQDMFRYISRQPTKKTFHCCSTCSELYHSTHLFRASAHLQFDPRHYTSTHFSHVQKRQNIFQQVYHFSLWCFKFKISHFSFQ